MLVGWEFRKWPCLKYKRRSCACIFLPDLRDSLYGDGGFCLSLRLVAWELRKRFWLKCRQWTVLVPFLDYVADTEGLESDDIYFVFIASGGDQRNSHGVICIM